jgi:hypothetical protein
LIDEKHRCRVGFINYDSKTSICKDEWFLGGVCRSGKYIRCCPSLSYNVKFVQVKRSWREFRIGGVCCDEQGASEECTVPVSFWWKDNVKDNVRNRV